MSYTAAVYGERVMRTGEALHGISRAGALPNLYGRARLLTRYTASAWQARSRFTSVTTTCGRAHDASVDPVGSPTSSRNVCGSVSIGRPAARPRRCSSGRGASGRTPTRSCTRWSRTQHAAAAARRGGAVRDRAGRSATGGGCPPPRHACFSASCQRRPTPGRPAARSSMSSPAATRPCRAAWCARRQPRSCRRPSR
jgi:hypothetical protein